MERDAGNPNRLAGLFFMTLTLGGWASSPLFIKYFVDYIDAWTSNGWRYAIATTVLLPVLLRDHGSARPPRGVWRAGLWPAAFNAAGQCAFAWVLYLEVDPGLMTFLLRMQIVTVTAGAFLLFRDERALIRRAGYWIGLLLVLVGTAGMVFLGERIPAGVSVLGIIIGLFSGALFGAYAVAVRACMSRYTSRTAFAVISLYTAVAMVLMMLVFGDRGGLVAVDLTGSQMLLLALSALVGITFGHVFYYASIARLGVAVASLVLLLHPFATAAMSWAIYGERLTILQWVSGTISVLGAAVVLHTQGRVHQIQADTIHAMRPAGGPIRQVAGQEAD
jgi:drug/metabolite transporter (DMT)-like permease